MGGYTIARNGKRKKMIGMMDKIYLISLMIPFQILMIPIYRIFRALKMQNSLLAVIIVLTGTSVAYATFLYVGFVKSIPVELEEAALIDGCGPYRTFVSIVFPMLNQSLQRLQHYTLCGYGMISTFRLFFYKRMK